MPEEDEGASLLKRIAEYSLRSWPPMIISVNEIVEMLIHCRYKWWLKYMIGILDPADPIVEKVSKDGSRVHNFVMEHLIESFFGSMSKNTNSTETDVNSEEVARLQRKQIDEFVAKCIALFLMDEVIKLINDFAEDISMDTGNHINDVKARLRILIEPDLVSVQLGIMGAPDIIVEDPVSRRALVIELKSRIFRIKRLMYERIPSESDEIDFIEAIALLRDIINEVKGMSVMSDEWALYQLALYAVLEAERLGFATELRDKILREKCNISSVLWLMQVVDHVKESAIARTIIEEVMRRLPERFPVGLSLEFSPRQLLNALKKRVIKWYKMFDDYVTKLTEPLLDGRIRCFIVYPWGRKELWPRVKRENPQKVVARIKLLVYGASFVMLEKIPSEVLLSRLHESILRSLSGLTDECLIESYDIVVRDEWQIYNLTRELGRTCCNAWRIARQLLSDIRQTYLNFLLNMISIDKGLSFLIRIAHSPPTIRRGRGKYDKCRACHEMLRNICVFYQWYRNVVKGMKMRPPSQEDLAQRALEALYEIAERIRRESADDLREAWVISWIARFNLMNDLVDKYRPYLGLEKLVSDIMRRSGRVYYGYLIAALKAYLRGISAQARRSIEVELGINDVAEISFDIFDNAEIVVEPDQDKYYMILERSYRTPRAVGDRIDLGRPELKPIFKQTPVLVICLRDYGSTPLLKVSVAAMVDSVTYDPERDRIMIRLRPLPYYLRAKMQFLMLKALFDINPNLKYDLLVLHIKTSIARLLLPAVAAYEMDKVIRFLSTALHAREEAE
ncbi:hypothetical protein DRN94_001890 [archaeon]|nr:hypothetical protein [archaeon]